MQLYMKSLINFVGSKAGLLMEDLYNSIASPSEGLYKESGSRFLSLAYPCSSSEQALEIVAGLKKKYHDATHHCYAYRIGIKGDVYRLNDDGEPSSTAARPIYGEILSAGLSDILIVVVRWFGGIKLGVPGLIKAYKSAAKDALSNAKICVKTASAAVRITFEYPQTDFILKELKKAGAEVVSKSFENECVIEALVPVSRMAMIKKILNLHSLKIEEKEN